MPAIPALSLLALLAALAPPPPLPAARRGGQAQLDLTPDGRLHHLHVWMDRFRKGGHRAVQRNWRGELSDIVAALRAELAAADPERRDAILYGLLDLAGLTPQREVYDEAQRAFVRDVQAVGRQALERELRADPDQFLARWLAHEVLAGARRHPPPRVLATLGLLENRHLESTQLALFSLVLHGTPELRRASLRALQGWPSTLVDEFLSGRIVSLRELGDDDGVRLILQHFERSGRAPAGRTARQLRNAAAEGLVSADWRTAIATLDLTAGLADVLAVPALIRGLATWVERREQGLGRRRVEAAIVHRLEDRSGRRMGARPERWQLWWDAVLAGEATTASAREAIGPPTRAAFFGLRPESDRVVFVIDRSRSMSFPFGTSQRSRFDEAIDQLGSFLEAIGPRARFRLVLFDDRIVVSSRDLVAASEAQIAAAKRWMRTHGPRGGTVLRGAIEEAMRLEHDGSVDLERLEADTVIVLCDGETQDGTGWIAPLFDAVNDRARLVFHGVQIGGQGRGALGVLAALSGGQFVEFTH